MDSPDSMGGQVSPEEAMQQLIQLRMQLGPDRFSTVASQMGMPAELLEHIEQSVAEVGTVDATPQRGSGLLDASGRPLSGGSSGLVDLSGRPISSSPPGLDGISPLEGVDDEDEDEEDGDEIELDEETSRQMFQELVGVRMIIGPENFTTLAEQMGMPAEASEMVELAAGQVESEIATRYDNQDEAMTVRLVNARMMMGQERFTDFAGQVGMPANVIEEVETIAGQIEEGGDAEALDDEDDEDEDGPSLA
ncbi:MAG TPA: hypothetical protein VM536_10695 [Chloroflexia bacterium]|nr:hypothetical protein [Chloroflexia bacterium]